MFFKNHLERTLFAMKLHHLDLLFEYLAQFYHKSFLDAGLYEHFTMVLKRSNSKSSMVRATILKETSESKGATLEKQKGRKESIIAVETSAAKSSQPQALDVAGVVLSMDGYCASLEESLRMIALPAGSSKT